MVKTLPSSTRDVSLIPGQGTKIPCDTRPMQPKINKIHFLFEKERNISLQIQGKLEEVSCSLGVQGKILGQRLKDGEEV